MTAALHRAAKSGNPRHQLDERGGRRRGAPRSGAHASRWADDDLPEHTPRPPRLRAERRAWRRPLSGGSRVGQACHYGYDAHGNIAFLTDASGAVTDSYDYDAWGNVLAITGSTPNTRRYASEELDPDLGLINLRARQYSPTTGRFSTSDPLDRFALTHRYLYAEADPVTWLDSRGLGPALEYVKIRQAAAAATIFVYRFIETTTGRFYFGITNDPMRRLGEHAYRLAQQGKELVDNSFQVLYGVTAETIPLAREAARAVETGLLLRAAREGTQLLNIAERSMSLINYAYYIDMAEHIIE